MFVFIFIKSVLIIIAMQYDEKIKIERYFFKLFIITVCHLVKENVILYF